MDSVSKHSGGKEICLLLDQYPSHCSEIIKTYALTKKVKLSYVPKAYTHKLQQLDVGINKIIKEKVK